MIKAIDFQRLQNSKNLSLFPNVIDMRSILSSLKTTHMKSLLTAIALTFSCLFLLQSDLAAQQFPAIDKSPADISTFRVNKQAVAKVVYSRPQKNGRDIFGNLVPFDKIWRTGANECTEITFYKDVVFGGQEVKAGTYALFTIPGKEKWTLILNKAINQWGSYGYDVNEDVCRFEAAVKEAPEVIEAFAIIFFESDNGAQMIMAWDKTMVPVSIEMK